MAGTCKPFLLFLYDRNFVRVSYLSCGCCMVPVVSWSVMDRWSVTVHAVLFPSHIHNICRRLHLKCDGTRAETRFYVSAKRTSPFKSSGASVQSTTGSRGVRISGSNAGYTKFRGSEGYWLPTPFASFPFTSPPVSHRVPSHFNWTLPAI